nr:HK97 family phage prohead protease [Micromonospora sp. DSM 115978]
MSAIERRYTPLVVELRASADSKRAIGGYAAIFGRYSRNLGGFVEVVDQRAFNKSRGDGWPDVIARYNHDDNMLLGTTGGGTLRLATDDTGLSYEVDPPAARQDIVELVQRGDVRKSSFAFRVAGQGGEEWTTTDQGYPLRSLVSVQLVDVAPVNTPAYVDTTAALRSLAEAKHVDPDEVRSMAERDELRGLFVRTDGKGPKSQPKPRIFGPQAAAALLARKSDPYA